jgi:predicted RNA binding protein YcfA (HicA-like mRNA interferase family)
MSNTPQTPHPDFKANGLMTGLLKRKAARRGFYYGNVGEDSGSISATVPGPGHVERVLGKSEPEMGEPLQKYDYKYADLKRALESYGWVNEREGGGHIIWDNPALPTSRPVPIKRNHASGSKPIDDDMLKQHYLKEAGLTIDRQGVVVPLARHPFAQYYRDLGYSVPGLADEKPETQTWEPAGQEGLVSVPIAQVVPTSNFEEWRTAMHEASFARGQGHKVPPVTAQDQGDGTWLVDQGHEQLEAARRHGMTHVPLKPL